MLSICPGQPNRAVVQQEFAFERNGAKKISGVCPDATTFLKNFEGLNHPEIA
jgi:hypothetical protein